MSVNVGKASWVVCRLWKLRSFNFWQTDIIWIAVRDRSIMDDRIIEYIIQYNSFVFFVVQHGAQQVIKLFGKPLITKVEALVKYIFVKSDIGFLVA